MQRAAFAADHDHAVAGANGADRITRLQARFFELGRVRVLAACGRVVNVHNLLVLAAALAVGLVAGRVVPDIDTLLRRSHNVVGGHGRHGRLNVNVLRVDGCANGVAEDEHVLPAARG